MKYERSMIVAVMTSLLGCGCVSVHELTPPKPLPVFVKSFEGAALAHRTREFPCALNLVNCVQNATVVDVKMSGARESGPTFPIGDIVRETFNSVVDHNFRRVGKSEQARIELKVESRRVLMERDWNDVNLDLELAVLLLNPKSEGRFYFSRAYRERIHGRMIDSHNVPSCVYEAVQRIARRFVDEINADHSLMNRL